MKITLELVRDEWTACYDADRLASLYDRPMTALEVLTRKDGLWAQVSGEDRLWTVMHEGVIDERTLRLFACDCAERAVSRIKKPDARSLAAIEVARRFANGEATADELDAARDAAYAASNAARAAERRWQVERLVGMLREGGAA